MSQEKKLPKEEKKALYDARMREALDAGISKKQIAALYASGKVSLEEAKKAFVEQGGVLEQGQGGQAGSSESGAGESEGQGDAGSEPGAPGQDSGNQNPPPPQPPKDPEPPKVKGKKEWKVNCNVYHSGVEFKKDQVVDESNKHFNEIRKFLE